MFFKRQSKPKRKNTVDRMQAEIAKINKFLASYECKDRYVNLRKTQCSDFGKMWVVDLKTKRSFLPGYTTEVVSLDARQGYALEWLKEIFMDTQAQYEG